MSLRRVKLISLTQVSIGTSLRRLKLFGLNYLPMIRHKDISNRSAWFTYQSRRCDDVSAWSATSRPIWDLNETSLRLRMPGGCCLKPIIPRNTYKKQKYFLFASIILEKWHDLSWSCSSWKFNLHHLQNISAGFKLVVPKLCMGILLHANFLLTKYFRSNYYWRKAQ